MYSTNSTSVLLIRYIMPFELIIGIIGNTLNAIIFTRSSLRSWSASHYFLCSALDRLAIYPLFIVYMLADGYGIDIKTYSSISCKLLTYFNVLFFVFSPNFLILATIDRFCITSLNANLRKFSVSTISYKLILVILIFFSLFFIHIFFMFDAIHQQNSLRCTTTNVLYNKFLIIIVAVLTSYLPTILFVLFNILIAINIQKKRQQFNSSFKNRTRQKRIQRTYRELISLLFVQVIINFICSTPYNIILLLTNFYFSETETEQLIELITITHLLFYFNYCNSFYIYTLTSRCYRKQLMKLFFSHNNQ